ncbi:MAG TPA: restriction endonuclease subunit S [Candidatus Bathyarchaeia archaeon]|nr:restriction endonuclease subunit S [Candidatus Bathyarchaeia archaeon]
MFNQESQLLPAGWEWASVVDIADFLDNQRVPVSANERERRMAGKQVSDLFPYYGANGQVGLIDDYIFDEDLVLLAEDGGYFGDRSKSIAYKVQGKSWVNNHAHVLRPRQGIEIGYLLSVLNYSDVMPYVRGTTRLKLNQSDARKIRVPLPPTNAQKRIVAKVEALFAESKTAREVLDKVPLLLRRFRQSILAKAFSGELTQRDPNDEPAQKLLEKIKLERKSYWEEDLRRKGKNPKFYRYKEPEPIVSDKLVALPSGWVWTSFETVCWEITVGHVGPMVDEYVEEGIPFLRSLNVRENRYDPQNLKYVSSEFHKKLAKSHLFPGNIVTVRSGNVGVSCVIPGTIGEANCSDLVIVRPISSFIPEYGSYFLNSFYARDQINSMKVGIAQTHFNIGSMKKILIPLAPFNEQKRIVQKIAELNALSDIIEISVAKSEELVDRIDQAILAKAFRGELVLRDPNDEPASILLQRIKSA